MKIRDIDPCEVTGILWEIAPRYRRITKIDADDLVQQTYMELLARGEGLELKRWQSWVRKCGENIMIKHGRREKYRRHRRLDLIERPPSYVVRSDEDNPDSSTWLLDAIATFAPKQQRIVCMLFGIDCIQGTQKEIAAELGATVASVNAARDSAMKKFRALRSPND